MTLLAQPGDVLVLELQTTGPVDFAPVEWHEQIFQAIRIATANGLVVIEAAGNGFQDLDDDIYLDDPDHPHNPFLVEASGERVNDSGAIMVGAAAADAQWKTYFSYQPGERLSFSNHGARVDVHAWGEAVVTSGDPKNIPLYDAEGENLIYCSNYGGTSSATAILGGVATSLQGAYKVDAHGQAMTSEEMRSLLIATGTPQLGDEHIGPMPDLRSAIEHMNPALPSLQPLPFAERPVADALLYCSGYRMPKPRFSLESGMLSIPDSPLFADFDFGGRVIGEPLQDGNIDDLLLLGSVPLDLEFGPVLVEGSEIYYTTDGSQPALCTGQGCGSTRVWTWEDSLQGNHIRITQNDLPMTVLAIMTTEA